MGGFSKQQRRRGIWLHRLNTGELTRASASSFSGVRTPLSWSGLCLIPDVHPLSPPRNLFPSPGLDAGDLDLDDDPSLYPFPHDAMCPTWVSSGTQSGPFPLHFSSSKPRAKFMGFFVVWLRSHGSGRCRWHVWVAQS